MAFHNIECYKGDYDSFQENVNDFHQFNVNNRNNNVVEVKIKYRNITKGLVPPSHSLINKRNIRSLTIGVSSNFRDPNESGIKTIEIIKSTQCDPKSSQSGPNRKERKVKSKFPSAQGDKNNPKMSQKKCQVSQNILDKQYAYKGFTTSKINEDKGVSIDKECVNLKLNASNQDPEITSTGPDAFERAVSRALEAKTADDSTDSIANVNKISQETIEKSAPPKALSKIDPKEVSSTVEVDSAIPFSCITTPEIVSSCNTTTSTTQSDAIDQKQPRSVISSNFNGLPLTRPNYGSTASTTDEYKKSLDENGNAVQGFNSPLSGSSQHKKPRRKKSSKNETVIKSHQIDGYQGNKDLNEVLRFIESNADGARAHKLGRAKHKDDSDDKCTKKRSTERRKDKESKIKRATSMEELSRTKLEDLTDTDPPLRAGKARGPDAAPAKPERRSWGDDARAALLMRPEPPADADAADPAAELTDFQTVTKKRKPRRRTDEAEREPATEPAPRRRPPSPRARRISAPPSDRSNDSNDDMDSVHSLPAAGTRARHPLPATAAAPPVPPALPAPPAPAPPASYADIARTRHNIPDLIESCNFYGEGEAESAVGARATRADSEYPALAGGRRARDKAAGGGPAGEAPAPDVVADRRPAVVLLAAGARARELDGVTFGFDVNEQLLGGARADVVRDAEAVGVRAGCAVLRYLPPPAHTAHHTHLIVDYVQAAWEDIMKCGSGKVKYYSD
ncbi:nucleolar protein dao-5-like isoform X3 [Aricia agestis]|uniref:nucleolar protein dao-5-like isoform X3 n=1 Tax=Aricia agestis TaxID=91739 RepID=UPI001C208859|nr:nucleolar protein dao-5-like isoform X3 [Aricia agestis]